MTWKRQFGFLNILRCFSLFFCLREKFKNLKLCFKSLNIIYVILLPKPRNRKVRWTTIHYWRLRPLLQLGLWFEWIGLFKKCSKIWVSAWILDIYVQDSEENPYWIAPAYKKTQPVPIFRLTFFTTKWKRTHPGLPTTWNKKIPSWY